MRRAYRSSRARVGILALAVVLLLAGCAGLPDATKNAAKAVADRIGATQQQIDQAERDFGALLTQSTHSFMSSYRDGVEQGKFGEARAALDQAKQSNESIKTLLDEDDPAKQGEVDTLVERANGQLDQAGHLMVIPRERADKIVQIKAAPAQTASTAQQTVTAMDRADGQLQTAAASAKQKHADRSPEIDKRVQQLSLLRQAGDRSLSVLQAQLGNATPQYAIVLNEAEAIAASGQEMQSKSSLLIGQLADLDTTIVRTLTDMKVTCVIKVSRTSWDENSDLNTDLNYTYPDIPSENADLCLYWADFDDTANSEATFANWASGRWSGEDFQVNEGFDKGMWDRLSLDHVKDKPSSHNRAEYYLEGIEVKYFQQLTVTANGIPVPGTGAFTEVSAEVFDDNEYDLNMDVYQKPVGFFDDEANTEASPPGMAYVGDPQYGEWQDDPSGNGTSFWVFYGQYRFFGDLLGGPVYRTEYTDWRTNYYGRAGYYGTLGSGDRWGTLSAQTAARYPNSTWVKSGGQTASVRGAGPSGRAGGPGGGGK